MAAPSHYHPSKPVPSLSPTLLLRDEEAPNGHQHNLTHQVLAELNTLLCDLIILSFPSE